MIDGLGMRLTIVIMQRYAILQSCVHTTVVQQSERSHTVESSSPFSQLSSSECHLDGHLHVANKIYFSVGSRVHVATS